MLPKHSYFLSLNLANGSTWRFSHPGNHELLTKLKIWLFDLQTNKKIDSGLSVKVFSAFELMMFWKSAVLTTDEGDVINWSRSS